MIIVHSPKKSQGIRVHNKFYGKFNTGAGQRLKNLVTKEELRLRFYPILVEKNIFDNIIPL